MILAVSTSTTTAQSPTTPYIQLTNFNGGEVVDVGSTYRITWTGADCGIPDCVTMVYVGLYKNGQQYAALGETPFSAGGLDWTICPSIEAGDDYSIRLVLYNCWPAGEGYSDKPFTVRSALHPAITISSPATAETLQVEQPLTVRWSSVDLPDGDVLVEVRGVSYLGSGWGSEIGATKLSAGKLDVVLPDCLQEGSHYRIAVTWNGCERAVTGLSELVTIVNPYAPGPLVITSPNGGEVWHGDEPQIITWTGPGVDWSSTGIVFEVDQGDPLSSMAVPYVVVSSHRIIVWPCVAWGDSGSGYFVRLMVPSCGVYMEDRSDVPFSVQIDRHPSLTLLEPNGAQVLHAGEPVTVRWTATDIAGDVSVILYKNGYNSVIGSAPAAVGELTAPLCSEVQDGSDYTVMVSYYEDCGYYFDASDAPLTVIGSSPEPTLTLTSPRAGDVWSIGHPQTITWEGTRPSGDVHFELYRHGEWVAWLGQTQAEAGEMTFDLCSVPPAGDYQILVIMSGCGPVHEFTGEKFTVLPDERPPPILTLTRPNGGEVVESGSHQVVTWSCSSDDGVVDAELYLGSLFVRTIGTAPASAGRLEWDVCPFGIDSDQYNVMLSQYGRCPEGIHDVSDAPFAILNLMPAPKIELTAPILGDIVLAGSTTRITWTVRHPTGTVSITLWKDSLPYAYLGEVPMAQGYFDWEVCPWLMPGSFYSIQLSTAACSLTNYDMLTNFTLQETNLPSADLDHDCDVDTDDLAIFERCVTGPAIPYDINDLPTGCLHRQEDGAYLQADLDRDGDVDQSDFGLMQRSLTGNRP